VPDEVLSSSSRRTQETFEGLKLKTEPTYTRALYHAGPAQMLDVLRGAQGRCVLMLGHNPGIAGFAEQLLKTRPVHDRFFDYPTGATTVMSLETENWQNVQFGTGTVTEFVIPRELPVF
jgi:phosphohistidine phosphatase